MKEKYNITGMSCAACQMHVNDAVCKLDGVKSVNVNLLQSSMDVEYDENKVDDSKIIDAVVKAGYGAYKKTNISDENVIKDNSKSKLIGLIISFVFMFLIMYFQMGNMMWGFPTFRIFDHNENPLGFALVQFVLTLPIIYINRNYFISGYKRLFKGPNMDSLIAIGASFSIIYGIFAIIMISVGKIEYHDNLYFEAAAMILTLVSFGKYLEELSKKKTTSSIEKLIDLAPKEAIVTIDGKEVVIDSKNIKKDDIIVIKTGMSLPVDGIIIEGKCSIDQSNITGESIPVYKEVNDEVYSSTTLKQGYIKVKATNVGEDTSLSKIIKLVEEASNSKAPISRLADKVSRVFVPIILAISLLTFIVNYLVHKEFELSFRFAITVIVIACPCALGLATPVAIMVATGKGASMSLLIKNAAILENTRKINTIVLDKTGTITYGTPEVTDYIKYSNDDSLEDIIYSIENMSEHPLASAIIKYFEGHNIVEINDYNQLIGKGLVGSYNGDDYYIGNLSNAIISIEDIERIDKLSNSGKTPLVVTKNDKLVAILAIKDKIKETSKEAIEKLKDINISVYMLTGDNDKTAKSIAKEVGIDNVISNVRPDEKEKVISSLKNKDGLVAMVGDGVNDAIALTSADIGIAIGSGSDVAIDSADIILQRNSLLDIVNVIRLSKRTYITIIICLFWAFFYNMVCVIIATGIFYPHLSINPMIGSIAMSISSVSVVLTALSINLFKKSKQKNNVNGNIIVFKVPNMMCDNCVSHVRKAIMSVDDSLKIDINLKNKKVIIVKIYLGISLELLWAMQGQFSVR